MAAGKKPVPGNPKKMAGKDNPKDSPAKERKERKMGKRT